MYNTYFAWVQTEPAALSFWAAACLSNLTKLTVLALWTQYLLQHLKGIFFKFATSVHFDSRMNWEDFGGHTVLLHRSVVLASEQLVSDCRCWHPCTNGQCRRGLMFNISVYSQHGLYCVMYPNKCALKVAIIAVKFIYDWIIFYWHSCKGRSRRTLYIYHIIHNITVPYICKYFFKRKPCKKQTVGKNVTAQVQLRWDIHVQRF